MIEQRPSGFWVVAALIAFFWACGDENALAAACAMCWAIAEWQRVKGV